MQVIRDMSSCPRPVNGAAVTIGAYDGVHLGHRSVIAEVRRLAAARHLCTAVVTFDQHPATVVRPESAPRLLTDLDQKLSLLATTGVDFCQVVHFDAAQATEPAEEFVRRVLVECLSTRLVVVGADFHFGYKRRGNVALLTEMGTDHGFDVLGLDLVGSDGAPAEEGARVSSTAIRAALSAGDLATVHELLGRPHEVRGVVRHGDKRGRELGFPTANVAIPEQIQLPADGIYAGWLVRADGSVHPSAISLGRRPTFYVDQRYSLLEAHLLDFDGDLYDEAVAVRFGERLRGEVRFDSVDDLVAQIRRDCDDARRILQAMPR